MAHARLGPSNHRWPNCPGSVREEERYPDVPGAAAIDGTGSHLLLELCLQNGVRAESYDGQIIGVNHEDNPMGWLVSPDRIKRVQECLDYVSRRVAELKAKYPGAIVTVESETRSNPGEKYGRSDWWGTVDITITVTLNGEVVFVEVADYKDGQGMVGASGNSQLYSYMAGKLPLEGNIECRMTIVQPKTNPSVRYCGTYSQQIGIEANKLALAAEATDKDDAPLIPGDHCKWCKHKPNCSARGERALGVMKMDHVPVAGNSLFELVHETFGDITAMSSERLAELADARAGIEAVFDKVEAEMQRRIETGVEVPGYAMQPGRMTQVWNAPEEDIVKMLKGRRLTTAEIFPPKLISPAQVLKLDKLTNEQKEKISKQYISKVAGSLKLTKVRQVESIEEKVAVFADVVPQQVSFF